MDKPKLFSILKHRKQELTKEQIIKDMIAGVIVAIIALPLSVALGISSGVTPEKGLITAIIAGFIISFLGGSRVQIGGPTGAFVVIVFGIIEQYGISGLIIATIMSGVLLIIFGLLKFGNLIKYIPYPITVGFTSGIAITLFSTQVKDFLGLNIDKVPSEFISKWEVYFSNMNTINWYTVGLGIFSLAILIIWPKINKIIPGSLIALILATAIAYFFKLPVATIGSQFGEISSQIPIPTIPYIDMNTITSLIKPAFTIALLAGIESLLSAVVADGMIGSKHNSNIELIAQGTANIFSGLFGGIPATGAIARTAANVKNGGRTPIAGMVHAITLLLIMLIFMPLAKYIPLTTLGAILMIVSYNMSEWRTFKAMLKAPKSDIIILLATFMLTVIFDLVIAIEAGMIISMCLFMRKMAISMEVKELDEDRCSELVSMKELEKSNIGENVLVYEIRGPLFFGAVDTFINAMQEVNKDADVLILRMRHTAIMDITGYKELKRIEETCKTHNISLVVSEIQKQPKKVMRLMGMIDRLGENSFTSRFYEAMEKANEIINNKEIA